MKIEDNSIVLSTGKTIGAYGGAIGLTPDGRIVGGWDDMVFDIETRELDKESLYEGEDAFWLNNSELVEIADYMIEKWKKFKNKYYKNTIEKFDCDPD